jgi:hypothetical protein
MSGIFQHRNHVRSCNRSRLPAQRCQCAMDSSIMSHNNLRHAGVRCSGGEGGRIWPRWARRRASTTSCSPLLVAAAAAACANADAGGAAGDEGGARGPGRRAGVLENKKYFFLFNDDSIVLNYLLSLFLGLFLKLPHRFI